MSSERRRKELADFLKTRRLRLSPKEVGLPIEAARRRTSGLRREEVASLSGISLPWYTALEQGRDIQVSEQVLESLARTLRFNHDERKHLLVLANHSFTSFSPVEESVPPSIQPILDRLGTYPAYVIDRRWNVLAWNQTTSALCGSFQQEEGLERNVLWRIFMMEKHRSRIVNWENVAALLLAHFRSRFALNVDDAWYQELITMLLDQSVEFREWWARHEVSGNLEGEKVMHHPLGSGLLSFRYHTFKVSDNGDYLMKVYTPIEHTGTNEQIEDLMSKSMSSNLLK